MDHIESHTTRQLGSVPSASMKSVANVFEAGDVLYGRLRPYLNKVYLAEFSGYCSTEFIVMPENRHVSGKFLKYRLNSDEFVRFANGINTGDRPRVKFDQIASFRFLLPPMTEQIRVVGMIDELFSDLDTGIANLISARDNLSRYRTSLLKAAVSGQLTKKWREEHSFADKPILSSRFPSHGRSTADPRAKYPLPDGWRWDSLENISTVAAGNPAPQGRENFDSDGAPFVRVQDMGKLNSRIWLTQTRDCVTEDTARSLRLFPRGAVLFTKSGASTLLNQRAILSKPMHVVSHIAAALPEGGVTSEWLYFCLSSVDFADYAHATTLPSVPLSKIRKIPIPVAPAAEQSRIVEEIGEQLDMLQRAHDAVTTRIEDAGMLRQAILGRAFAGRLIRRDRRRAEGRSRGERARRIRPRRTQTENPA